MLARTFSWYAMSFSSSIVRTYGDQLREQTSGAAWRQGKCSVVQTPVEQPATNKSPLLIPAGGLLAQVVHGPVHGLGRVLLLQALVKHTATAHSGHGVRHLEFARHGV